ncbi:hypothetical protein GCM10011505_13880 [Tistrella bauzanensis]|uniref:Uncharacterized protein n=1 Tax=Tistrella bauzanensis TaxID=657419 RepID=A0ABQ1ID91_9PROT|nr:hypothetical protein GCM10011505_13880 [Tistrella bauzanensis]
MTNSVVPMPNEASAIATSGSGRRASRDRGDDREDDDGEGDGGEDMGPDLRNTDHGHAPRMAHGPALDIAPQQRPADMT